MYIYIYILVFCRLSQVFAKMMGFTQVKPHMSAYSDVTPK